MEETCHVGWLSTLSGREKEVNDRRVGSGQQGPCSCVNIPGLVGFWINCEP